MTRYSYAHERVRRIRGSASDYLCVLCEGQAQEWAYDYRSADPEKALVWENLTYSQDPSEYVPMCHSCHVRFDKGDHCNAGHEYTPENTYLYRGHRYCKICRSAARQRFRERVPVGHPEWRPGAAAKKKAEATASATN